MATEAAPKESLKQSHIPVVRVYPWDIGEPKDIIRQLNKGLEPEVTGVLIGIKSEDSGPSSHMLSPIGGTRRVIDKDRQILESPLEAAYRELGAITTLKPFPYCGKTPVCMVTGEKGYSYRLNREPYTDEVRDVTLVGLPVLPQGLLYGHMTNEQRDKYSGMVRLSHIQFLNTILGTPVEGLDMIEAFTVRASDVITLSPEDRKKRMRAFRELSGYFTQQELDTKRKIGRKVQGRFSIPPEVGKGKLINLYDYVAAHNGHVVARDAFTEAIDEVRADMYSSFFRERELEVIEKPSQRKPRLEKAPHPLERQLDEDISTYRELITKGNLGVDILHLLPILTLTATQGTTKAAVVNQRMLRNIFDLAAERNNLPPDETYQDMVAGVKGFKERVVIATRMHEASMEVIAERFGFDVQYVKDVWRLMRGFISEFGESIRAQDPGMSWLYQSHEERNEVIAALFPELRVLSKNHSDPVVRFEAGRKLAIFFRALLLKKDYDRRIDAGNKVFDQLVLDFFGGVTGDTFEFTVEEDRMDSTVEVRSDGRRRVVVDQKPIKTLVSLWRKTLEKNPAEIRDEYAYSIAYVGPDPIADPRQSLTTRNRVDETRTMISDFISTVQAIGYPMRIRDEESNFGAFLASQGHHEESGSQSREKRQDRRTGSMGDHIIRTQFTLDLEVEGQTYTCEFNFYPFVEMPTRLAQQGWMGWKEKHVDDPRFFLRRVLQGLKGTYGLNSVYELIFPGSLYPKNVRRTVYARAPRS